MSIDNFFDLVPVSGNDLRRGSENRKSEGDGKLDQRLTI
jgi:hypothetical protein